MAHPPLFLIHGSATGSRSWSPLRSLLRESGVEAESPDLIGYRGDPLPEGWSIDMEARRLLELLGGPDGPPRHIVAHSLGSMFALHLRRLAPQRVARMTLFEPVLASLLRDGGQAEALAEMAGAAERFIALGPTPEAARMFLDHWSGAGTWDRLTPQKQAALAALAPRLRLEMIATRDDATPLAALLGEPLPLRVVLGTGRHLTPPAVAAVLQAHLQAEIEIVEGAGHNLPMTHPAAAAAALLRPGARS